MKTALAFIRRRVRLELALIRYLEGHQDMSSPQFDALVQAIANLTPAKDAAVQAIQAHAAVTVDPAQLVSLTQQVQAATDALNQAVADHPVPAQG
jgi:hypothetical protein